MTVIIYHHPDCSKSRKTLAIIRSAGIEPVIVPYLEDAPQATGILDIASQLGVSVADLLRRSEPAFRDARDLPDLDDDVALAGWLALHPAVLQRPIVLNTDTGTAIMGRPPENVRSLLG